MLSLKKLAVAAALCISSSAWAFMPASGNWQIDAETTGAPGRGFQIEVQNEIAFFTYFGYRADGSSLFYYAAGKIVNNVFSADLLDIQGGTVLGAPYKGGNVKGAIGTVTLTFSSGEHGTVTLPGEATKAISKDNYGYVKGPDGLLGTWLMAMIIGGESSSQYRNLNTKTGSSTTNGNGMVATANYNFACEYLIAGSLAGHVICVDSPQALYSDVYLFKMSGDRGTGTGNYWTSATTLSSTFEAHLLRTTTKSGAKTGLNNGTSGSLANYDGGRQLKQIHAADGAPNDEVSTAALASWASEVRGLLPVAP